MQRTARALQAARPRPGPRTDLRRGRAHLRQARLRGKPGRAAAAGALQGQAQAPRPGPGAADRPLPQHARPQAGAGEVGCAGHPGPAGGASPPRGGRLRFPAARRRAARRGRRQAPRRGPDRQHDLERTDQHLPRARPRAAAAGRLHGQPPATSFCCPTASPRRRRGRPRRAPTAKKPRSSCARRAPRPFASRAARSEPEPQPEMPAQAGGMEGLVEELAAAKVTVSTIAIGEKPNLELMRELASLGQRQELRGRRAMPRFPACSWPRPAGCWGKSIVEEPSVPRLASRARVDRRAGLRGRDRRCTASWSRAEALLRSAAARRRGSSRCWCRPNTASARRWRSCPTSRIAGPRSGWAGTATAASGRRWCAT